MQKAWASYFTSHWLYPHKSNGKAAVLERQGLLAEVVTCPEDHVKTSELVESQAVSLGRALHFILPLSTQEGWEGCCSREANAAGRGRDQLSN